jgi:hypothetical protein
MAIKIKRVWKRIQLDSAYASIEREADSRNKHIILAIYSCEESKKVDHDTPLYHETDIFIPDDIHATMFCESALKQADVSALSQSYMYLKSLPQYADCEDV